MERGMREKHSRIKKGEKEGERKWKGKGKRE
jgi:hypothetical protein